MSTLATITVPREYGWVILAASSTYLVGFWLGVRSGIYRRATTPAVPYPKPYAVETDGKPLTQSQYLFNCAQRGHGNFIENQPTVVPAMLVAGLAFPLWSAGLGLAWSANRVLYALGYTRADKDKGQGRLMGIGFWLCQLGLIGLSFKTGYDVLVQ